MQISYSIYYNKSLKEDGAWYNLYVMHGVRACVHIYDPFLPNERHDDFVVFLCDFKPTEGNRFVNHLLV